MKRLFPGVMLLLAGCGESIPDGPIPGVSSSSAYAIIGPQMEAMARELILARKCSLADFKNQGGFVRSTDHARPGQYFIFCGGHTIADRIYIRLEGNRLVQSP